MFPTNTNLNPPPITCRMTYAAALRRIRSWKKAKNPRKWLNLSYLNLTELPPLPSKLRRLKCDSNLLISLKGLPTGLLELECSCNDTLTSIDDIPDTIKHISIISCASLATINRLPSSLNSLCMDYMGGLLHIAYFPPKLEYLSISETPLETIPLFPESLRYAALEYTHINTLPPLPKCLETLITNSCYITTLPQLPNTLKYLYIRGTQINSYPIPLPESIRYFECNNSNFNIGVVKYYKTSN